MNDLFSVIAGVPDRYRSAVPTDSAPTQTAYVGGRYFTEQGDWAEGDVVVEGADIISAGDGAPDDATVVDCRGKTILPGLIDMHFHLTIPPRSTKATRSQLAMRAVRQSLRTIRAGTTTVRNVGQYGDLDFSLKGLIDSGQSAGPRIISSGSFIHITGGHGWPVGRTANGPEEVRAAVREQISNGAEWIKLMCSGGFDRFDENPDAVEFGRDEIEMAVQTAALRGVRVAVHAHSLEAIKMAVEAGVSSVEHCSYLDAEAIKMMVTSGTFMVPTIAVYDVVGRMDSHPLKQRSGEITAAKLESFQAAIAGGVPWAVGSDGGVGMPMELLLDEIVLLVTLAGLDAKEVLSRATRGNADLLGLTRTGLVREGYVADLIIVDGDPIANIADIARIEQTVVRGKRYDWMAVAASLDLFSVPKRAETSAKMSYEDRPTPSRFWAGAYSSW